MPRKPNYDFERREREKAKAEKLAAKAKARDERNVDEGVPSEDEATERPDAKDQPDDAN